MYRFGTYSTSDSINAGLDLEMPGPTRWRGNALQHAVSSNKTPLHVLDERVRNVLNLVNLSAKSGIPENAVEKELNRPEDQALLRRTAAESIVLLKNEKNVLPFDKNKSIAVIGPHSKVTSYCGGGSASLAAYYVVSPFEGVQAKAKSDVHWSQGVYAHKELPLLGPQLKTADGKRGYTFRAYNDPPSVKDRELLDELHLVDSSGFLMDYYNPKIKSFTFYVDMEGEFTPEEDGLYDFGVTVAGTGQLFIDGELVVDNTKDQRLGSAFFGIGTEEKIGSKELKAGQTYKVLFQFGSAPTSDLETTGIIVFGPGGFRFGACKRLTEEESIANAVELASKTDQVVVFAGINKDWESEGFDRPTMDLPPGTDTLISKVLAANPNAAIVIQSGTPVTMPWANDANALVQAWYGGNETGNGIADVLYGDVNPSGKLSLSFPIRVQDNPSYLNFKSERGRVLYGEDVYVGYRYYEKTDTPVLFPFGHGLSYTSFTRSDLSVTSSPEKEKLTDEEKITVSVAVTNTGAVAGAEVVQVYVAPPGTASINRPVRELKGFSKVFLQPAEKKVVEVVIEKKLATSFWDEVRDHWISEQGDYEIQVTGTGKEVLKAKFAVEKTRLWKGL